MKRKSSPLPPVLGTVAMRTRRQQKTAAANWNQPLSVILRILMFADPDTVRILCCVSQQFLDIIRNSPLMKEHRVIPLLQISASKFKEDCGRSERLMQQLYQHRAELQQYRAIKFIGVAQFCNSYYSVRNLEATEQLSKKFQLHGVVSLDISSPTVLPEEDLSVDSSAVLHYLAAILPNLQDIHCSNGTYPFNGDYVFCSRLCPRLEKITCNNIKFIRPDFSPCLSGSFLRSAENLKEIYMDDCEFCCYDYQTFSTNSDGRHTYSRYLFHHCCGNNVLERLSIKNAVFVKYTHIGSLVTSRFAMKNYQNMLIKFVRKAPQSLQWFRSDLTQGNIDMLQSERPGIELVS